MVPEASRTFYNHMEPIEVIKNSNKAFVRQKYLIWNGGTDTQTDTHTHRQTHRQTLILSCAMRN